MVDRQVAAEAVAALEWVVSLELTEADWAYAEEAFRMLEGALAAGDDDGMREAAFALDQLSLRVDQELGQDAKIAPATGRQRDRVATLVHDLAPAEQERGKQVKGKPAPAGKGKGGKGR